MDKLERKRAALYVDEYMHSFGTEVPMASVRAYVCEKIGRKSIGLKDFALVLSMTEYAKGLRNGSVKPPSQADINKAGGIRTL